MKDLTDLLLALGQQRQGLGGPPISVSDLARMQYQGERDALQAAEHRNAAPIGYGPARLGIQMMRKGAANRKEEQALKTLLQALEKKSGLDSYQAELARIQQREDDLIKEY